MTSLDMQRNIIKQHILEGIRVDPRIVGCVDYGSTSEGRGDEWSDLDIALFIEDSELESFKKDWKQWASQFGNLLLASDQIAQKYGWDWPISLAEKVLQMYR